MRLFDRRFADLTTGQLLSILKLRVDVFVVEQACPYPELDARDAESGARHLWLGDEDEVLAYVRLLDDGTERRIGRVVTAANRRGAGHAGRLINYALENSAGPWVLDAQAHLEPWYAGFGFDRVGAPFVDYGIAHVTMRRPRAVELP